MNEGQHDVFDKAQDNNQRMQQSMQNKFESQFNNKTSIINDLKHGISMMAAGTQPQNSICYQCGEMGHFANVCPNRSSNLFINNGGSKKSDDGRKGDRDRDRDRDRDGQRRKDGKKKHGSNKRKNPVSGDNLVTGVVTLWRSDRSYGFIKPNQPGDDLYVHKRNITDGDSFTEGDTVKYVLSRDKNLISLVMTSMYTNATSLTVIPSPRVTPLNTYLVETRWVGWRQFNSKVANVITRGVRPLLSPTVVIPTRPLLPPTGGPQRAVPIGPVVERLHR
jgi:cold shock CspA family protein